MKVLFLSPYIYDKNHLEFTRNKTGFGIMVEGILRTISLSQRTFLVTHVITKGYKNGYHVIKHSWKEIVQNLSVSDLVEGIVHMIRYKQPFSLRLRYLYYFLDKGSVRKTVRKLKPDIVHIHGITYQTKPYIELCQEEKIPFLITMHGTNGCSENNLATKPEREFEKEMLKKFDGTEQLISVVSSGVKRQLINTYELNGDNLRVVLNGTECVENIANYREPHRNRHIVVIGNICSHKNQMQVIEAFNILPEDEQKSIEIFFCGGNNQNLPIEQKIARCKYSCNLHYMGFVEKEKLEELWRHADLNLVASVEEGFGLSIIEGYVRGVPTLTFADLSAVTDLYNENTMYLIKERTTEALAEGILQCLRKEWDRVAILKFSKNFWLKTVCTQYLELYKEILKREWQKERN